MIGRIISCGSILSTAVAFELIAKYGKDSKEPISFWSGDTSLKNKVTDVPAYNREMAALYKKYAVSMFVAAAGCVVHSLVGLGIFLVDITLGLFLVYRAYKKILSKYS